MRAEYIKTVEAKCGTMSFFADDEYIGRALQEDGAYSEQECDLLVRLLKLGDNVIEAGSNIGAITLPLAAMVGDTGTVFAFEPQPETFALLKRNVAENEA